MYLLAVVVVSLIRPSPSHSLPSFLPIHTTHNIELHLIVTESSDWTGIVWIVWGLVGIGTVLLPSSFIIRLLALPRTHHPHSPSPFPTSTSPSLSTMVRTHNNQCAFSYVGSRTHRVYRATQSATARLMKELQTLAKDPSDDIILYPKNEDDMLHWVGFIKGSPETPFEGGMFELDIRVPENYPLQPPTVRFQTKVFHPNIHFKVRRATGRPSLQARVRCSVCAQHSCSSIYSTCVRLRQTGEICLDVLKSAWSAVYTLQSICRSIIALLAHPEPDSPLNCDCGNLLRSGDVRGYNSMARMYTRLFASYDLAPPR